MLLDDLFYDRESKPGAIASGRVEGLEDGWALCSGDSLAVVCQCYLHGTPIATAVQLRGDGHPATSVHSLNRIQEQVGKDLHHAHQIHRNARELTSEALRHRDLFLFQPVLHHQQGLLKNLIDVFP